MVLYVVGNAVMVEGGLLLLPLITALIYRETCAASFIAAIAVALVSGFLLTRIFKPGIKTIYAKEGFVITALCWFALSLIGALPFYLSREIPAFVDAFFETVSGFSTTGASILTDVEAMSKSLLLWRAFTHWIGGMGVLVFVMAVIPSFPDRTIHLLRAEVPGPVVGKLVPKARQMARILYVIYIALTLLEIVFLFAGKMSLYDSIVHALSTAGTGGYGIMNDSVASYNSYIHCVLIVFMLLFGINFNLYYFILIKKAKVSLKSTELWTYLGVVAFSTVCVFLNILPEYGSVGTSLKHALFQVSSFITTTGFSTTNFNEWPILSKTILFLLMFIGGCAGSTAGGFKFSRAIMLAKNVKRELHRVLHPRTVGVIRFEGKAVDEHTINSVSSYLTVYTLFFCVIVFLIGFEKFDLETNLTVVATCYNNIGPAFGAATTTFAGYSPFGKLVLCVAMLLGRLEIYPIILTLSPSTWAKK